ncbi:MAG: septum site-determining protein MinC [Anaerolineales bacterium]|nr:septum site-determining protein MinC [Anaerolineales bacterium]
MSSDRINIKGTSDGLIITLGAGAWPVLVDELEQRLAEKASFFKGGRVGLAVGSRQLTLQELEQFGQTLDRHHVTLWAVESESPDTQEAAAQLGLEIGLGLPVRPAASPPAAPATQGDAMLVQRTLRSGQVVHHPGHVVVIGDVNPGAEIRAGGSVVVWGRLRGTVHAGSGGDKNAVVCALQLSPTQLRIGDYITRSPADDTDHDIVPEMASVQGGQIVAEPWK